MQHDKHRERLRKKLLDGVALEDHEILEMLLFYALPRINTNELAHDLIDQNGSLAKVLCARQEELMKIDGIGEKSAVLMRLIDEISRRTIREMCNTDELLTSEVELDKYLCSLFALEDQEKAYLLAFNRSKKLISTIQVGEGLFAEGRIYVRKAVDKLKQLGATGVIVAHNHPNGIARASDLDIKSAEKLNFIFDNAGMSIVGHYVYAGGKIAPFEAKSQKK